MRFSLIDKIVELDPGTSIQAVKNLSLAEEYLQDHFPGFPVMPGVLMLEAMVQTSAWLMRATEDFEHSTILLKEAKAVKFNSFLKPGQTLNVSAKLMKSSDTECTFKASGEVNGESTVSARLILSRFNMSDKNPDLAKSDERLTAHLRELFAQLWTPPA